MKLLHFSDLHLDARFASNEPPLARKRRQRLRDVLRSITSLAIEVGAEALLCGGDLYENDRFSADTGEFLRESFAQLAPIPVYLAPGNHDWLGPASLYRTIRWTPNVFIFQRDRLEPVSLVDGLTLWGAAHCAPANTDGFLREFTVDRGGIHLALFHGSERGSLPAQGGGKIPHAPFDASDLERCGIHHAFLGHYHTPHDAERFTYPGNPEPLTFGESGQRGPVVITIQQDGTVIRDHRQLAITEIHDAVVDITGCGNQQEIRERMASAVEPFRGIVRVTLEGEIGPDVDLRVEDLENKPPELEQLVIRTRNIQVSYDFQALATEPTVRGQFVKDVLADSALANEERRRILVTGLRALAGREDLEIP